MLNELVIDAYHDLRDALARAAAGSTRHRRAEQRMRELAHAYRQWAREHPHRYELLFKPPFPGYDAHAEPLDAVPSGSHLANSHGASDIEPERSDEFTRVYNERSAVPFRLRSHAEVTRFFDGTDLVEPGLVQVHRWRTSPETPGYDDDLITYCGLGRKR